MEQNNYLVTARKYRPKNFDEIIGQEHITQTLVNSIKSNKISHAFIFSGPRGIGKTSTARVLAKSLNCPNTKDSNPCDNCETCRSITNGGNMDVIEIDGASNRKIDEIRALRENVKYAPSGKYKIFIIDEVHMLTTEAFNALLKTLEEPPPNVIFIFATTDLHKVPTTILSRCQRYDFKRLSMNEIKNQLKKIADIEKIDYEIDALSLIAKKADGAMRDAQSLFDQMIVFSNGKVHYEKVIELLGLIDDEIYFQITNAYQNRDIQKAFEIVNNIYYQGWDAITFINGLIEHFRNLLVCQVSTDYSLIEAADTIIEKYKEIADSFSKNDLIRIIAFLNKSISDLKNSPNQKLSTETIIIQLIQLPNSLDIESLINEIKELKKNPNLIQTQSLNRKTIISSPEIFQAVEEKPSYTKKEEKINLVSEKKPDAPLSNTLSLDEIKKKWELLIEEIKDEKRVVYPIISNCSPHSLENNNLFLKTNKDDTAKNLDKFSNYLNQKISVFFSSELTAKVKVDKNHSNNLSEKKEKNKVSEEENNEIESFIFKELGGEII